MLYRESKSASRQHRDEIKSWDGSSSSSSFSTSSRQPPRPVLSQEIRLAFQLGKRAYLSDADRAVCEQIVDELKTAFPAFLMPLDPFDYPDALVDYYTVIKQPADLTSIEVIPL